MIMVYSFILDHDTMKYKYIVYMSLPNTSS